MNQTLTPNGTHPATDNLNQWYQPGDQAFIIVSACMVLLMVPGIAFLYSGLSRRKSALSLIWVVMMSFSVIIFQWYFWGYSLAFSKTATNGFIGDLHHFGLLNTLGVPSPGSPLVPELLYSFYQVSKHAENSTGDLAWRARRRPNLPTSLPRISPGKRGAIR